MRSHFDAWSLPLDAWSLGCLCATWPLPQSLIGCFFLLDVARFDDADCFDTNCWTFRCFRQDACLDDDVLPSCWMLLASSTVMLLTWLLTSMFGRLRTIGCLITLRMLDLMLLLILADEMLIAGSTLRQLDNWMLVCCNARFDAFA
jgi:hypothetical protein